MLVAEQKNKSIVVPFADFSSRIVEFRVISQPNVPVPDTIN